MASRNPFPISIFVAVFALTLVSCSEERRRVEADLASAAQDNITHVEVVDFPEMGMEAVRKITVKDFPAFIICDDKGNDFFQEL